MRYRRSLTIISVLGGLVNKGKGKVHPGSIYDAAVCGDKGRLLEEHGNIPREVLSKGKLTLP